jgi:hypothetical protein
LEDSSNKYMHECARDKVEVVVRVGEPNTNDNESYNQVPFVFKTSLGVFRALFECPLRAEMEGKPPLKMFSIFSMSMSAPNEI